MALVTGAAVALGTTAPGPAAAVGTSHWCQSARDQVVRWSLQQRDSGRPHVTAIRRSRVVIDRVIDAPSDGIVLRCRGRADLSNGFHARVSFGYRSIGGTWYLFLHRGRR
ncbi:MAG: hypothetical protein U0R64_08510 [Candidatus Nanopelagicales bacterium]